MGIIIGLTGGIASGKSTVSTILKERQFTIIDADVAARKVAQPGEEAYNEIVKEFGSEILLANQEIDRQMLGEVIFHDEEKRRKLNSIVHPAVRKEMLKDKEEAIENGKNTIFMDIPLLFESNLSWMVEKVIVVYVDQETQLSRLMKRNYLSEEEANARIASQMSLEDKVEKADAIINNIFSLERTEEQVKELISSWGLSP
ncbi:dephospho-CoA kinase [Bacillus sp. 2205SS5-2]|uniref:dephospho-CoA kinase n=1 Tax=Bacillus sp. 2205SS5-2 TaxID=3109031 RepID=UPI0030045339